MEIGTEISQKIRSAIKAKLIDLGAYVDDELPDYIMVMVANKKTKKQMADDLQLFLSHNTDRFTEWLHMLLKKLQSINNNTGQEPSTSKHKSKDKYKTEKRKHKTSQSDKSSKSGEPEKKKSVPSADKTSATSSETGVVESSESTSEKSVPATTTAEETEINISENTDEFNEENKEIDKKPESTKSSSTGKPPPAKVAKSKKSTDESKKSTDESKKSTDESKKSTERRHSGGKAGDSVGSGEARKKPSSAVVAVKRKYEEFEDLEEEYDPTNPAVGSVASIIRGPQRKSSVPKSLQANRSLLMKAVSDAEKSVTSTKKPEAHEEEPAMRSDRKPVDLSRRLKTAAGLQLISRSKRKDFENLTYTVKNDARKDSVKKTRTSGDGSEKLQYTIKQEPVTPGKGKKVSPRSKAPAVAPSRVAAAAIQGLSRQSAKAMNKEDSRSSSIEPGSDFDDGQYGPPLPDTRLVQHVKVEGDKDLPYDEDSSGTPRSTSPAQAATDPEIQRILDESHDLTEETEYLFQEESNKRIIQNRPSSSPVTDPKFIVTLDGVDPSAYSVLPDLRESLIQTVKPEVREPVTKPERPMVAVEPEQTLPPKIQPPKIKPFNINLKDTDDEEEEDGMDTSDSPPKAVQEKCRFWPACVNGNACQFIHPSIPCKTFPYCKFGDKCLYIHPNCKFDVKCTRPDCPFTHSCKRPPYAAALPKVIHKVVQVPVQSFGYVARPPMVKQMPGNVCRFYPNCTNMSCPFIHPKPCRYGISCANKAACMFQHPALPEKDKLRWSAAPKKDTSLVPGMTEKAKSVDKPT